MSQRAMEEKRKLEQTKQEKKNIEKKAQEALIVAKETELRRKQAERLENIKNRSLK